MRSMSSTRALLVTLMVVATAAGQTPPAAPPVDPEFQSWVVLALTRAEAGATVPASGWEARRTQIIEGLKHAFGRDLPREWPELRPRVEGSVSFPGYRMDQVTAEFWPGVRHPMQVLVPEGAGPFPTIILACAGAGGRSQLYHGLAGALARLGFLVVATQAIGKGVQGPAYRYHSIALLAGTSMMQEQFNSFVRVLDYLDTRTDVDRSRVGMTGDSNGGGASVYISAMDSRVKVLAPASINFTYTHWLLPTNWQTYDFGESPPPGALTFGANLATLVAVNAPKPLYFLNSELEGERLQNIPVFVGAATSAYELAGARDRFSFRIDRIGHGLWPPAQVHLVRWFSEQLLAKPLPDDALVLGPKPPGSQFETLVLNGSPVVTYTDGSEQWKRLQIGEMPTDDAAGADGAGFLHVIDTRRRDARPARAALAKDPGRLSRELARVLGIDSLAPSRTARVDGGSVSFETEPGLHVAGNWVARPPKASDRVALVVGTAADRRALKEAGSGARFDLAIRREEFLLVPRGALWPFTLLNRPPLGMWVWDAMTAAAWLKREGFSRVDLVGAGDAGAIVALMTGVLSRDVASVRVTNAGITSIDEDVVGKRVVTTPFWAHRLLWVADLPELRALLASEGRFEQAHGDRK